MLYCRHVGKMWNFNPEIQVKGLSKLYHSFPQNVSWFPKIVSWLTENVSRFPKNVSQFPEKISSNFF